MAELGRELTTSVLTDLLFDEPGLGRCLVAPDGSVLRANAEWLRSTGFTLDDVLGANVVELFPEARDMALALHARARAGHAVEVPRHAQRINGRETWWEGRIDPVPMDGGTGLLLSAREVTPATVRGLEQAHLAAEVLEHGDGVFVLDSAFRFVLVNAAFERAAGISRDAILGRVFWDVYPLAARPESRFFHEYHRAMRERVVVRFEETYPPKGTWNAITAYPTRAGGIAVFFRDVTERRRAEEALAVETERYRSLFEHSLDAVYLTLQDGTILDANRAACRLHGMSVDEIKQAGRAGLVVNDERHAAALEARAATGQVRTEMTVRRKDGTTLPVEVGSVLLDPARPDSAAFVISRDITERKRIEAELREAAARYEGQVRLFDRVASTTPDFVYVFDLQGRFLYANRRLLDVWGMQLQDVIGRTCRELGYEQWHHDLHMREIAQVIETKRPIKGEVPFKAPLTGIFGVYEYIFTPVLGPDGAVETVAGTTRDITERKHLEQELRDADRRKTEFLAVLSHELRNPLAPIRNSIHLLERAPPGSDQAARAIEVVRRQTEHLTRLVDDLLDITRISRGKIPLRRGRIDLREVVRRTTDDLGSVFTHAGIGLDVDHATDGPVWIDADPTRIAQVLGNLLTNSVKFTPSGGSVRVTVGAVGGRAELRVRDDGAGMEPGIVERMFEPFAQADQSLARTNEGLGLGLALVRSMVELHGGAVEARSDGPGRGAEFVVRLPLAERAPGADGARRAAAEATPLVIVLVEDNVDGALSLADVLALGGHRVHVAHRGRSGIELARELRPDVVLCDIGLPDIDGYEVAKALRCDQALRGLRLVALSGYAQPEDRQRARDAGFDAHLAKPPDLEEMMRVLAGGS